MYNIFVWFLLILTMSQVISYNLYMGLETLCSQLSYVYERDKNIVIFHIGDQYFNYVSTSKVTRGCMFKHKLFNNIKLCNQSQIEKFDFRWVHS